MTNPSCRDCGEPATHAASRETDPQPGTVDPASNPPAPVCRRHAHPDSPELFHNPAVGTLAGYAAGACGHRVALSEWFAGFRTCERCPGTNR